MVYTQHLDGCNWGTGGIIPSDSPAGWIPVVLEKTLCFLTSERLGNCKNRNYGASLCLSILLGVYFAKESLFMLCWFGYPLISLVWSFPLSDFVLLSLLHHIGLAKESMHSTASWFRAYISWGYYWRRELPGIKVWPLASVVPTRFPVAYLVYTLLSCSVKVGFCLSRRFFGYLRCGRLAPWKKKG